MIFPRVVPGTPYLIIEKLVRFSRIGAWDKSHESLLRACLITLFSGAIADRRPSFVMKIMASILI